MSCTYDGQLYKWCGYFAEITGISFLQEISWPVPPWHDTNGSIVYQITEDEPTSDRAGGPTGELIVGQPNDPDRSARRT